MSLIRRGLNAGVREDGILAPRDEGGPQGGHLSVVLSPRYLHAVRDRWFERVVKPRRQGEAYLMRSLDDVVGCFPHQADAPRFHQGLVKRLATFALALEPRKTRLVAFGRVAERPAKRPGTRRETCTLLGFPLYGTRTRGGTFTVGWRTDKARLRRRLAKRHQGLPMIRHAPLTAQATPIHQILRGHYAYEGIAGHLGSRRRVDRSVERSWRTRRSSRRQKAQVRWEVF